MKRVLFLVAAVGLGLAACKDTFQPPEGPDLYKEPYDFSVLIPPYDATGFVPLDMAKGDMSNVSDHD